MNKSDVKGRLITVKISDLIVNEENPRIVPATTEEEAIIRIIEDQRDNLLNLCKDIIVHGLSPIEKIAVYREANNKYIVIEGNRRVTCLKIIKFRTITDLIKKVDEKLYNRFINLLNDAKYEISDEIEVYESTNREHLEFLMERRHLGLDGGRGLAVWDSLQKERYKKNKGDKAPLLEFLDTLVKNGYISSEDAFGNINLTNWQRILGSIGQKELAVAFQNSKYHILDQNLFTKKIGLVIKKLRHQKVKIVYDNEAIEEFFSEINNELNDSPSQTTINSNQNIETNSNSVDNLVTSTINAGNGSDTNHLANDEEIIREKQEINQQQQPKQKENFPENKYALLTISTVPKEKFQIYYLYREVSKLSKSKQYQEYPMAFAFLIRALFEQSLKYWCETYKKPISYTENGKDLQLSKIIEKLIKSHSNHVFDDKQLNRIFIANFNSNSTSTSKDILDVFMHTPKYFSGNYLEILSVVNGVIFDTINYILNKKNNL